MKTEEGLVRAVGVRGLTAGMVNYMIGAGIFVLPAVVAVRVGAAAPVIYIICAVAMAMIVLCFADAGSRVSLSGGTYAYAEVAFGPYVGFIVATSLWFGSTVLASAAVANVFMDTLSEIAPVMGQPVIRGVVLVLVYALFAFINIRGVKVGSRAVQTVTLAKLTPLLILVAFGLFALNARNLAWPGMPAGSEVARTTVMLLFAFLGIESALTPSGEVRDPARTVPRAIFSALVLVTLLYMAIQVVAQGILGPALATESAPLTAAARRIAVPFGVLIGIGAVISTFGHQSGMMLATPRVLFAFGRDGVLPSAFARVHPRFRTPHVAIITQALVCALLAITSSFAGLAVLATVSTLALYLVCCIAAWILRRRDVRAENGIPFRIPGGALVPVLAVAVIVWLLSSATAREFLVVGAVLAAAAVLYVVSGAHRARRGARAA